MPHIPSLNSKLNNNFFDKIFQIFSSFFFFSCYRHHRSAAVVVYLLIWWLYLAGHPADTKDSSTASSYFSLPLLSSAPSLFPSFFFFLFSPFFFLSFIPLSFFFLHIMKSFLDLSLIFIYIIKEII